MSKIALFTDIHFGRKQNSEQHNNDCLNFVKWFCENVKNDPTITCVGFLGDWHEQRNAINGMTLNYSYQAAKLLDELNLPIYFIVGNHDLYYKINRNVYTTTFFNSLKNFNLIDQPKKITTGPLKNTLFLPYLFPDEYVKYREMINSSPVVFGHLEFKGFVVTGETIVMQHGPDADELFKKPKKIFTGHFHKRQIGGNVHYIGNTFPMDFSDANDYNRGMAVYDLPTDNVNYINWDESPCYIKTSLSELGNDTSILRPSAVVRCLADVNITFEESNKLKQIFIDKHSLREFTFEEPTEQDENIKGTDMDISGMELESTSTIVKTLLTRIEDSKIESELLVKIYDELKID